MLKRHSAKRLVSTQQLEPKVEGLGLAPIGVL